MCLMYVTNMLGGGPEINARINCSSVKSNQLHQCDTIPQGEVHVHVLGVQGEMEA